MPASIAFLYTILSVFLLGALVVLLGLWYKRKYFKGKVKLIFYTKDRRVVDVLAQPNEDNMFEWNGGQYLYSSNYVQLGTTFLGEGVPTLTYIEDNPHPVEFIEKYAPNIEEITARQLSADFDDKMARELSAVTQADDLDVAKPVRNMILLNAIALGLIMLGGFWFMIQKFQEISISGG